MNKDYDYFYFIFLFVRFITLFLSFVSFFYISNKLNFVDFGFIQLFLTYITFGTFLFSFGFDSSIFKVSLFNKNQSKLVEYFQSLILITLITIIFCFILFYFFVDNIYFNYLFYIFVSIPINVINIAISSYFKGSGSQKKYLLFSGFLQNLIFTLIILNLNVSEFSEIVNFYILSQAVNLFFAFHFVKKSLFQRTSLSFNDAIIFLKKSFDYYFIILIGLFLYNADLWILSFIGSYNEVAIYSFAAKFSSIPRLVHESNSHYYQANKTKLLSKNNLKQLQKVYTYTTKKIFILTFPFFLLILFFINDILKIISPNYLVSSNLIVVLFISSMINLYLGPVNMLITFSDYNKKLLNLMIILSFVYVLSIYFSYTYFNFGLVGISILNLSFFIFYKIMCFLLFKKFFGLFPFTRFLKN